MSAQPEGIFSYTGRRREVSLALLVLVNLLPLAGVLYLEWDVASLIVLYWSENLVLGFYTLLKMLTKAPFKGLGMGAFFSLHYGGFCAGHGLFILVMLFKSDIDPVPGEPWPLFLVFFQMLLNVIREVLALAPQAWIIAFGALFVSHGASYVLNFLLGGERNRQTLSQVMMAPYARIVLLHFVIILGGGIAMAIGQPLIMLLVLVLLKTGLDYKMHVREHVQLNPESS